jgi:hypothetical protein
MIARKARMSINVGDAPSNVTSLVKGSLATIGLAFLVSLAILLRIVPILIEPSVVWGDEIFQTIEPAHRLVFGTGLVPWEFQFSMRSWLLPGTIAALMELSRIVGDGPDYYLPLIAVTFAVLAAAPVVCCFLWARPLFGVPGALLGSAAVAVAPELVYFGARTLYEVVASHLLIIALYVFEPAHRVASHRRRFVGGVLLGLIFVTRIQLAPALMIVTVWTNWRADGKDIIATLAGAIAIVAAAALLDTLTLGYPLASVWRYVLYNVYYGVSSTFGVESWSYYLLGELGVWSGAIVTLLLLTAIGAWRLPLLLMLAVTIICIHSGIAHKEYRFIYPAIVLVAVLSGLGLAQISRWGQDWLLGLGVRRTVATFASITLALSWWGLASLQVWTGATLYAYRHRIDNGLAAASFVAHLPAPCGVGFYGLAGTDWVFYGGYTYFHRPAPMYWPEDEPRLIAAAAGFDTLLFTKPPPAELGFTILRCIGKVCVARRGGDCRSVPMTPLPVPAPLVKLIPASSGDDTGVFR